MGNINHIITLLQLCTCIGKLLCPSVVASAPAIPIGSRIDDMERRMSKSDVFRHKVFTFLFQDNRNGPGVRELNLPRVLIGNLGLELQCRNLPEF